MFFGVFFFYLCDFFFIFLGYIFEFYFFYLYISVRFFFVSVLRFFFGHLCVCFIFLCSFMGECVSAFLTGVSSGARELVSWRVFWGIVFGDFFGRFVDFCGINNVPQKKSLLNFLNILS